MCSRGVAADFECKDLPVAMMSLREILSADSIASTGGGGDSTQKRRRSNLFSRSGG